MSLTSHPSSVWPPRHYSTPLMLRETSAMMSSTALPTSSPSNHRANQPTFLGIPPESRNAIYDHVFSAETKHSLIPHALTQVNQQIRYETRAMYYASVGTLKIPLHDRTQVARAKRWLTEADMTLYPALPDIELSRDGCKEHSHGLTIHCTRQVVRLNEEFTRLVARREEVRVFHYRGNMFHKDAMLEAYVHCLGFQEHEKPWLLPARAPLDFQKAVKDGKTWTVRQLSEVPRCCHAKHRNAYEVILDMFYLLAQEKKGRDWEIDNLQHIIDSFGSLCRV